MNRKLRKSYRWIAAWCGAGIVCQVGACPGVDPQLQTVINSIADPITQIFIRQTANIASDTLFFLLDNFLVRLTA
jgi:hypothetical protein